MSCPKCGERLNDKGVCVRCRRKRILLILLLAVAAALLTVLFAVLVGTGTDETETGASASNSMDSSASSSRSESESKEEHSSASSISSVSSQSAASSSQVSSASPSSQPAASQSAKTFSQADFEKIKTGMTYAQVVDIIGAEGGLISEFEFSGTKTQSYQWTISGEIRVISVTFQNGKVTSKMQAGGSASGGNGPVTLAQYNQIETGMTYEQVKGIFGSNGKLDSETNIGGYLIQTYTWTGNGTVSVVSIGFQNGAVTTMMQYGLK